MRALLVVLVAVLALSACGRGETDADPGPEQPEDEVTTTSESPPTTTDAEVETVETTSTSTSVATTTADGSTTTTVVIDQSSPQAQQYTELAASGLVLTLDEQACADESVETALADGDERIAALTQAVTSCASAKAVDDFAAGLLTAGGQPLPATEAACVSSELRDAEAYLPFWSSMFNEEPFDFLAAEPDAQEQYLNLFARCVSVGRALSGQLGTNLSPPTIGCIDDLYADGEFVRASIEADLSADPDDLARVNSQIATCLTPDEQEALGIG